MNGLVKISKRIQGPDIVQSSLFAYREFRTCRFNHTSRVVVVTPTDRPKLVHNRSVIEVFVAFCIVTVFFVMLWGCKSFCHRTESDICLYL